MSVIWNSSVLIEDHIAQGVIVTSDGINWSEYTDLPGNMFVSAISCPAVSDCWIAGFVLDSDYEGEAVANTSNGGQSWTIETPRSWLYPWINSEGLVEGSWIPEGLSCPTVEVCWVAGVTNYEWADLPPGSPPPPPPNPATIAFTTDAGSTWTLVSDPPAVPLQAISCTSATNCVAVGNTNYDAVVISTTDGGDTWLTSPDPTLSGVRQLQSISCVAQPSGIPKCLTVGGILNANGLGSVVLISEDGGATWSGQEMPLSNDFISSVDCVDAQHCWLAATGPTATTATPPGGVDYGTGVSLYGTADGGTTWFGDVRDAAGGSGDVACGTVDFCVAEVDAALWATSDDDRLGSPPGTSESQPSALKTQVLPPISAPTLWLQEGALLRLVGRIER